MRQQQQPNFSLGAAGEQRATQFLSTHGFQILDTNISCGRSEIDIVALDESVGELVFIEVKTRSDGFYGNPSSAVDRLKLRALRRAAAIYRKNTHMFAHDYRFDVIAVLPNSIDHYQNVTW